jgi:hypothetical protein
MNSIALEAVAGFWRLGQNRVWRSKRNRWRLEVTEIEDYDTLNQMERPWPRPTGIINDSTWTDRDPQQNSEAEGVLMSSASCLLLF